LNFFARFQLARAYAAARLQAAAHQQLAGTRTSPCTIRVPA
jgi:hypothetical protein